MNEQRMQIDRLSWYGIIMTAAAPKAIGITQGIMARQAGRGNWAATLLAVLAAALLVAAAAAAMGRVRTNLTLGTQRVMGPWISHPLGLAKALIYMLIYLAGLYTFVGHLQFFFLPEMPVIFFVLAVGLLSMLASHYGLETMARASVIGAAGLVILTIITVPGVIWDFNFLNLFPVHELGWPGFARAAGTGLADFMIPIALAVSFLPSVQPQRRLARHSALAVLAAGLLVLVWSLTEILVLGPALTAQQAVSCMTLARSAAIGVYIHRYELIMVLFFMPSVFLMGCLPFYGAAGALARVFHLQERKPVFLSLFVVLSGASFWIFGDRLRANEFFTNIWPPAMIFLGLLLLLMAVLTALLTRRPADKPAKGS